MNIPSKHVTTDSKTLIVIFQSFNIKLYQVPNRDHFELENTFEKLKLNADLLFLKDHEYVRENFYLHNVTETRDSLNKAIADYEQVVFTGISSGGWASMLYGSLLNVDIVVAINPQTRLRDFETDELLINEEIFNNISNDGNNVDMFLDVKPHINNNTTYYMNAWKHDKSIGGKFNLKDNLTYTELAYAAKLHDISNYNHLKEHSNVHWLDFMNEGYKNGEFANLLKTHNIKI